MGIIKYINFVLWAWYQLCWHRYISSECENTPTPLPTSTVPAKLLTRIMKVGWQKSAFVSLVYVGRNVTREKNPASIQCISPREHCRHKLKLFYYRHVLNWGGNTNSPDFFLQLTCVTSLLSTINLRHLSLTQIQAYKNMSIIHSTVLPGSDTTTGDHNECIYIYASLIIFPMA